MGVKGFSIFLNHIKCDWETKNLTEFAGKRMAIDAIMYLYQIKLSTRNPAHIFLDFFTRLRAVDISPIFVMDGKYVQEKGQEQAFRAQKRHHLQKIIEKITHQLENYKLTGEIGQDLAKVIESNPNLFINKLSKTLNLHTLSLHLSKLEREVSPIPRYVKKLFLEACDAFGVPVLWAKNDGEMLCAALNKAGVVDLVYSHDSDVFVVGAVSVIKQINGDVVKALHLKKILECAQLEFEAFRDMCILCGTDFNKRIPGIGPVTAYDLMKKYSSIEKIIAHTSHNFSSLNFIRVREIYSLEDNVPAVDCKIKFNEEKVKVFVQAYRLETQFANVKKFW